jgi:hypothetical protein
MNSFQKKFIPPCILAVLVFIFISPCIAQDSLKTSGPVKKEKSKNNILIDTGIKVINYPKIAATRSAILPGWGQIYNKKYWKAPIVWGSLVTCGFVFSYNLNTYKDLKLAYSGKYNARVNGDSALYYQIEPELLPLSEESLRYNRDQFRRNIDYTVLVFILLWGLNVVDAAVDAHLRTFDISPELSLKVVPGHSTMAHTSGLSLVLKIGK